MNFKNYYEKDIYDSRVNCVYNPICICVKCYLIEKK